MGNSLFYETNIENKSGDNMDTKRDDIIREGYLFQHDNLNSNRLVKVVLLNDNNIIYLNIYSKDNNIKPQTQYCFKTFKCDDIESNEDKGKYYLNIKGSIELKLYGSTKKYIDDWIETLCQYACKCNQPKQKVNANENNSTVKVEEWIPMMAPQMQSAEVLPIKNGATIDKRINAPLSNVNEILNNIGCLVMTYVNIPNPKRRGTAVILNAWKYSDEYKCNVQYGLTAAHNVIYIDPADPKNGLQLEPEYIEFEIRNNIDSHQSKVIHTFEVINWKIYPKYYDIPYAFLGYDIALIEIQDKNNILKNMKHIPIKKVNTKATNIAKVIGYPGKYKDNIITNWLYGMTGKYEIQKNQRLIEYSDINTSMGQSGAPILSISHNKNTINNIYNNWSNVNIIGIHTGGDSFKNHGTNINKDIIDWILSTIPAESKQTIFDYMDDEKESSNNNDNNTNNIQYRNKCCVNNWSNTDLIQFLTDIDGPLIRKSIKIIKEYKVDGKGLLLLPKKSRMNIFTDEVWDNKIMKGLLKYVDKAEAHLLHYNNNLETMHLPINIIDWTPYDVSVWMEYHLFSKFYDQHTIVKKNMNGKDILLLGNNVHDTVSYAAIINEIKKRASPTDLEYLNKKSLSKYFISYSHKK